MFGFSRDIHGISIGRASNVDHGERPLLELDRDVGVVSFGLAIGLLDRLLLEGVRVQGTLTSDLVALSVANLNTGVDRELNAVLAVVDELDNDSALLVGAGGNVELEALKLLAVGDLQVLADTVGADETLHQERSGANDLGGVKLRAYRESTEKRAGPTRWTAQERRLHPEQCRSCSPYRG